MKMDSPLATMLRIMSFVLALMMLIQIALPPYQVRSFLYGPFVCIGFYYIGRGTSFPNTWWFWLGAGILFFDISGFQLPIPNNRIPLQLGPKISMVTGCIAALPTTIIGIVKFFAMFTRDIRERRPIK